MRIILCYKIYLFLPFLCVYCVCLLCCVCVKECWMFCCNTRKTRDNNDPHTVLWKIICFLHTIYMKQYKIKFLSLWKKAFCANNCTNNITQHIIQSFGVLLLSTCKCLLISNKTKGRDGDFLVKIQEEVTRWNFYEKF